MKTKGNTQYLQSITAWLAVCISFVVIGCEGATEPSVKVDPSVLESMKFLELEFSAYTKESYFFGSGTPEPRPRWISYIYPYYHTLKRNAADTAKWVTDTTTGRMTFSKFSPESNHNNIKIQFDPVLSQLVFINIDYYSYYVSNSGSAGNHYTSMGKFKTFALNIPATAVGKDTIIFSYRGSSIKRNVETFEWSSYRHQSYSYYPSEHQTLIDIGWDSIKVTPELKITFHTPQ